ncbi:MAG: endonuclease/exonuclease/phosphatase family protein, partial [Clostridia bacterium]|nr:endonuclease/exonuclease/phosphatase family protein [Clostridia bacterium]
SVQKPAENPDEEQKEDVEKPEQKPTEQPDKEQENDTPVTDPEQKPDGQPDNTPPTEDHEENLEEDPEEEDPTEEDEETPEEDAENPPSGTLNPVVKPTTPVDPNANDLKIISYNVRTSNDGEGKNVADRAPRFKKAMDQYDPDIMGLQEVSSKWMPYLEDYFTDEYDYIQRWRAANSKEGTPIFWKKDKFTCLDSGYFWLSDTPDKESIAYSWGATKYYRICMWVKLRVKATGKIFLFYNTHFDTTAGPKVPSAKLVIERAVEKGGFDRYAVFCTGDFNMQPDTDGYKAMYARFHDINRDLNNDKTPTFTSYGTKAGSIIDFCFYSAEKIQPKKYKVITELVDGGHISDHYGLYIEAKLL